MGAEDVQQREFEPNRAAELRHIAPRLTAPESRRGSCPVRHMASFRASCQKIVIAARRWKPGRAASGSRAPSSIARLVASCSPGRPSTDVVCASSWRAPGKSVCPMLFGYTPRDALRALRCKYQQAGGASDVLTSPPVDLKMPLAKRRPRGSRERLCRFLAGGVVLLQKFGASLLDEQQVAWDPSIRHGVVGTLGKSDVRRTVMAVHAVHLHCGLLQFGFAPSAR
jgi:hypothetical protein